MEAIREKNGVQDIRIDAVERKCASSELALGEMSKDVTAIRTDLNWVMKIQWLIVTMSVGSIGTAIINLVFSVIQNQRQ